MTLAMGRILVVFFRKVNPSWAARDIGEGATRLLGLGPSCRLVPWVSRAGRWLGCKISAGAHLTPRSSGLGQKHKRRTGKVQRVDSALGRSLFVGLDAQQCQRLMRTRCTVLPASSLAPQRKHPKTARTSCLKRSSLHNVEIPSGMQ